MKKTRTVSAAISELSDGIEAIRARIVELKAEASIVETARVPVEEALARMVAGFDDMKRAYVQHELDFDSLAAAAYSGNGLRPFPTAAHSTDRELAGAMWFFFQDILASSLETHLRAWYATLPGPFISTAERPRRLQNILDQILALEFEEEDLICGAAAAGLSIWRRPDADPRAVLNVGATAELAMEVPDAD